jgi:hypothetical protein
VTELTGDLPSDRKIQNELHHLDHRARPIAYRTFQNIRSGQLKPVSNSDRNSLNSVIGRHQYDT